jgi:hypothetical protein
MANASMLIPPRRSAQNFRYPYVDDEVEKCIDLHDWVALVCKHLNMFQHHPLHCCLDWISLVGCVRMFQLWSSL